MNTNFQMLRELLEKYHPAQRGVMNYEEKLLIQDVLHIGEMDVLQLRNLRDFVVLYLGKSEKMKDWDIMSAITYCIDSALIELGEEI